MRIIFYLYVSLPGILNVNSLCSTMTMIMIWLFMKGWRRSGQADREVTGNRGQTPEDWGAAENRRGKLMRNVQLLLHHREF